MNLRELLGERVLFAHAHPDDETLQTGALIAACVNHGIETHVVTCTRGEQGESVAGVVPSGFTADELSAFREQELARAVEVLGVTGHYWLGQGPARAGNRPERRYTDSGMVWIEEGVAGPAETSDESTLTSASIDEASADLVELIRAIRPSALISYDGAGTYGHPDHVRTHEISKPAARATDIPFFEVASDLDDPAFDLLDLGEYLDVVVDALSKYRSQLTVYPDHLEHVGGQRAEFQTAVRLRRSPLAG
ncbi:PIG-L deacetylase family protein [Flaviflexus equikiangi]|uniref:PIG-L family deacetylase n=1 Tax=Flaviflexus equikiangi TaxID=2758573 RepID=A0ABS2TD33_9ACTO|nr:PIG-L family deacetylase [Flaviflexus equikiangi]MBM9432563.1 PIG-L family deacetylase [Flaviflexus equikiangi]